MQNPFKKPSPEKIRKEQLENAERFALAHEADAEFNATLATMYRNRADRLRAMAPPSEGHAAIEFKTGRRVA